MSYTYAEPEGGVFSETSSEVRYLIGDTAPAAPFSLSDGEIDYELASAGGTVRTAASSVAYKMGTRYASRATTSKSVGDTSTSYDYAATSKRYFGIAASLRTGADRGRVATVYFTGGTETQFALKAHDNASEE